MIEVYLRFPGDHITTRRWVLPDVPSVGDTLVLGPESEFEVVRRVFDLRGTTVTLDLKEAS